MTGNSETTDSFRALVSLLETICASPASYHTNESLIKALRSQGKLAKYSDTDLGIFAKSLNTVKRVAHNEIDGGFESFDRLRQAAQTAIEKSRSSPIRGARNTKTSLLEDINAYKHSVLLLKQDLLLLTNAFEKSMSQARYYASQAADPAIMALCETQQRSILRALSLRAIPVDLKLV